MKCFKYTVEVTTDIVHGFTAVIDEVYVPELGLFINGSTAFVEPEKEFAENRFKAAKSPIKVLLKKSTEKSLKSLAKAYVEHEDLHLRMRKTFDI